MIALYQGITIWPSRCIEFLNDSRYSHAAHIREQDGQCKEAWADGGVRAVASYRTRHTKGTRVDLFRVRQDAPEVIAAGGYDVVERNVDLFINGQLGKDYDWPGIFRFITRGKERDNLNPPTWFCSRLVFTAYLVAGVRLLSLSPWKVFPGMIAYSTILEDAGTVRV